MGQKAAMSRFIVGYDPMTAPAILVPRKGHTRKDPLVGTVSRNFLSPTSARQVVARDIRELRRVYPEIRNNSLKDLVDLNKIMYPEVRK